MSQSSSFFTRRITWILALGVSLAMACARPRITGETDRTAGRIEPASADVARAAFGRLGRLAGEWRGTSVGMEALATLRVTSAGTAITERIVVEDPVEMFTVYYMDRGRLVLTHYCAAGNQPRMYLNARSTPDRLEFSYEGGSNFAGAGDRHMHALSLSLQGDTAAMWDWHLHADAQFVESNRIALRRTSR